MVVFVKDAATYSGFVLVIVGSFGCCLEGKGSHGREGLLVRKRMTERGVEGGERRMV
jgi:hypothetical protein